MRSRYQLFSLANKFQYNQGTNLLFSVTESTDRNETDSETADNSPTNESSAASELEDTFFIIETYTDELLFADVGRRSLKVHNRSGVLLHIYTRSRAVTIFQVTYELLVRSSHQLLRCLANQEPVGSASLAQLSRRSPIEKPLTYMMFHIEDTYFDQFLTAYEATNWKRVLTMPLSVTVERARAQVLLRPEFKNVGELSAEDREAVNSVKRLLSRVKSAHF